MTYIDLSALSGPRVFELFLQNRGSRFCGNSSKQLVTFQNLIYFSGPMIKNIGLLSLARLIRPFSS